MKTFGLASLASFTLFALAACSSGGNSSATTGSTSGTGSGTSGGGSTTGGTTGPITVTFTTIDVHPAAKAALNQAGFPIPSITNGDYLVALDGVSVVTIPTVSIVLTDAGVATLTSTTGPYVFALSDDFLQNNHALLGVLGVVKPFNSFADDAGSLPQPTCPQLAVLETTVNSLRDAGAVASIPDYLIDAGFSDYIISTGLELGGKDTPPTASVDNAVAYAVPMSYAAMLNCAGAPAKTTRDTDTGVALVYITDGAGEGQGNPVSGAVVPLHNANPGPVATYYANNYSSSDTTGTDSTGVATYLGVSPQSTTPPTITVTGAAGLTFTQPYAISTQPAAFFSILAYPH